MLIKNDIPILEYDADPKAVIMPGHSIKLDVPFPSKAAFLFVNEELEAYVSRHHCEMIGSFVSVTKNYNVYKTHYNGSEITLCQAPLGGAAAVQILDQLIACGVREIIAAGCCGALVEDAEGDFFVPTAALRQEGTSYHYLPPSRQVELSEQAVAAIEKTLTKRGLSYRSCKTWTTDGFYRETRDMVNYRKAEGYSTVEMECASLAACAKMRGVVFGQLLFTADSLANTDAHDTRNWGKDTFGAVIELAMDAVTEI